MSHGKHQQNLQRYANEGLQIHKVSKECDLFQIRKFEINWPV